MKNKKAQIFTLIAISLIALLFVSYSVYSYAENRDSIKTRVQSMDNFLFSLEKDLQREIYVFGFRTIFLAEDQITKSGNYISNLDDFFQKAFFNGTVYGNNSDILTGVTYEDLLDLINQKSEKINVEIISTNPTLQVLHQDPWHISFIFTFNLTMQDKSALATWNKQENITAQVEVEGFEDPIYLLNTNGKITNKINKTIYQPFVEGVSVSNLAIHSRNSFYINTTLSPSFLNRLQGNLAPDENGIESLVYLPDLTQQGIIVKQKSVVDHIYFSDNNPDSHNIQGMPNWFRINQEHLDLYGVFDLIVQ